jgi:hypothetical protein
MPLFLIQKMEMRLWKPSIFIPINIQRLDKTNASTLRDDFFTLIKQD